MYKQATSGNNTANTYQEKSSDFSQDFDLALFIVIVRKQLKWILLFFVLAAICTYLFLRYTQPLYEASTIIQMTSQNTAQEVLNVKNVYEQDIAGEIELLRSKAFITSALSRINLEVNYFAKGKILNTEMYTTTPYQVMIRNVHPDLIGVPIYVSFPSATTIHTSYSMNDEIFGQAIVSEQWTKLEYFEIKISIADFEKISTQQTQFQNNPYFFKINNLNNTINKYYNSIKINLLNEAAKTIQVSVRDNNANKAADIVNAIAQEFIDYDIKKKAKSANKVLAFIDEQLTLVYEKLRTSENKMQSFNKQNKMAGKGDFITIYVGKLDNLESELLDLELEQNMLKEINTMITNTEDIDVYKLLPVLTGASFQEEITDLLSKLNALLSSKEEVLYTATTQSEEIKAFNYRIEVQKKLLIASIKALVNKCEVRKKTLKGKIDEIEAKFLNLPTKELEYARLLRLFSINEKFYTTLLEKKAEFSISKAGFVSKNAILEVGVPPIIPVSPDKQKVFTLGTLVALFLSGLLLIISYLLHNNIISITDISKQTSAAILGVIPTYKKDIPITLLLVDKNPKSLIAEAFRSIRTNLQFIDGSEGPKIIAVTSTVASEGKTFVTINLAGIIAFSEKKVIVLDLDLRKPKIHLGFNFENKKGISTILSNKDRIEDCIQSSTLNNLDVITAGPIPPNPSELIISKKMDELIEFLKTKYDILVIDNPPVGIVTDGISIIQNADYPIYVFRADFSKKNYVKNVDRLIHESNIGKLSVVLNGMDTESKYGYGSYEHGYGYGYGYAYGYGYYDEESEKHKSPWYRKIFRS